MTAAAAGADVVVVGAGWSGAVAARELAQAGHSVILIDGRDRVGGRAYFRAFSGLDQHVELGGTWISERVHPLTAREIERYGVRLAASHIGNVQRRWHLGGALSSDRFPLWDDVYELERLLYEIMRDARRIDGRLPPDRQDLADLDVSVAEYLDRFGASPAAHEFIRLWAALGSGALAEEWSMLTALSWIAAMNNSVFGWYGAVTDRLQAGSDAIVRAHIDDAAPALRLGTTVRRIEDRGDEVVVTSVDGEEFRAGAAIITAPIATWPAIEFLPALPEDKLAATATPHRGRMKKVWMLVEGIPGNLYAAGWGTRFVNLFPEYEVDGAHLVLGMCSPPQEADVDDLEDLTDAVREFAPGARVLAADTHDWGADPLARGSWMVNPPGLLTTVSSALARPEGRVFFAGSDVATHWIGWLEGALETGITAARDVRALIE